MDRGASSQTYHPVPTSEMQFEDLVVTVVLSGCQGRLSKLETRGIGLGQLKFRGPGLTGIGKKIFKSLLMKPTNNVVWHHATVTRKCREAQNRHHGAICRRSRTSNPDCNHGC